MTTSNNINTGGIDPLYPVAGSDNDSQGFRDNFKQIQDALNASKTAIATLEGTSPSTQGSNDFNDNLITKAIFRDTAMSAPSAETLAGETNVDYTAGHYRRLIATTEKTNTNTVVITNWSPAESMGHMFLEVRSNNSLQKFLNFSTPTGNILTDATNLNLSSDFDMADAGAKYIFEVWSPDQGANIFIYYVGAFK
tara:strand:- start:3603 stop:4187 length:585 start_codon:yes stop_codon:yes gene_type:complete